MSRLAHFVLLGAFIALGCGQSSTMPSSAAGSGGSPDVTPPSEGGSTDAGVATNPPATNWDSCNSVRLTQYPASKVAWCGYDRTAPMLPDFVRNGLTLAIAEPWDGSSFNGDPGEACGECWELTSLGSTQIAMVHDLCPIQGNPLCVGGQFDFDLSLETASALGLDGLEEGRARRVPCPVTGNAFLTLLHRDQWGTVQFQVLNQRFPVRAIEYHAVGSVDYFSAVRSAGTWAVSDDHRDMFNEMGAGGSFRITSARGEVVEMPNVLTYDVKQGTYFDLGAQFSGSEPETDAKCEFLPPADVYVDGYGGIPSASWVVNPWGTANPSEVSNGCVSGSCLRVPGMSAGNGLHLFYRQAFAASIYKTLHFSVRSEAGTGSVSASLTSDSASCHSVSIPVTEAWSDASVDITGTCAGVDLIRNVTFNGVTPLTLLFDNIQFAL